MSMRFGNVIISVIMSALKRSQAGTLSVAKKAAAAKYRAISL